MSPCNVGSLSLDVAIMKSVIPAEDKVEESLDDGVLAEEADFLLPSRRV